MNKKHIYRKIIAIFILPFLLVMCMTIENITHPDNPQVNSEIEIGVDLKLVPENDDNTKLIFAVLAPKSWNIGDNAALTFKTNGYTKGDIIDEQMQLVEETENEPTTNLEWKTALENQVGLMGNLGPVEWVVFESQSTLNITDEDEKLITAHVKIKLTTGSENIKLSMGYFFCGKSKGLHSEYYRENAKSKVLRVTGGPNSLIDYTTDAQLTTGAICEYSVFTVQNVSSEYFMEVAGDILYNEKFKDKSPVVQQESSLDFENQPDKWFRWYFVYRKTEDGIKYYQIMNAMSGKYLDVPGGISTDGLQLQQLASSTENASDEQLWQVTEVNDRKYKIVNKKTGLALTAGSEEPDGEIKQSAYSGTELQLWKLYSYEQCSYRDDQVVRFFERNDKSSGSTAFDQGSSISLANGKTLWITQDAWDGWELTANNLFYSNYFFNYGNSMFLQPSNDNWNPDEALNITRATSAQGKPRQICDIQPNQSFAWPANGVELNGRVYLNCGEGNGLSAEGQSIYELWPEQGMLWNSVRHLIPSISSYSKITYASGMVKSYDGYVYVYGAKVDFTQYKLYVARFSQSDPLSSWTFWNGSGWVSNPPADDSEFEAAKIYEGQGASVAVSFVNGKYVVMSLDQGFWVTTEHFIRMSTSDSPTGGFTEQKRVYDICENIYGTQARYYTPNIHPQFDNGRNELLITYSLNYAADDKQDITVNEDGEKIVDGETVINGGYIDPYFYRVKGVRVPYSLLGIPDTDIPSGIESVKTQKPEIDIFPNPVEDTLFITSAMNLNIAVYQVVNLNGIVVKTGKIENGVISVKDLSSGIYILNISNIGNGVTRKFVRK